jgi:hypothetical protein
MEQYDFIYIGGVEALSFTYVGIAFNTSGSSEDVTVSGLSPQVGDLLILFMEVVCTGGVDSASATKTGWTRHAFGALASTNVSCIFTKVAESGDLTTVVGDLTGATVNGTVSRIAVAIFRPNRTITEVATAFDSTYSGLNSGNISPVVKTAASYPGPNIVVAHYGVTSATVDPRTMTGATASFDSPHGLGAAHAYKGVLQNTSPADITVDMDDEGNNNRLLSTGIYFV